MIRKFTPAENETDFKLLLPAYLEMVNAPTALKYLSFTGLLFTETQVSEWFRTHKEDGVSYYVDCKDDDVIQGIATAKASHLSGFELLGLIVNPACRKVGIGKNLVRFVKDAAVEQGFKSINVSVFADNLPMLRLLLGLGFIPVSMTYHARYDGADVVHLIHSL